MTQVKTYRRYSGSLDSVKCDFYSEKSCLVAYFLHYSNVRFEVIESLLVLLIMRSVVISLLIVLQGLLPLMHGHVNGLHPSDGLHMHVAGPASTPVFQTSELRGIYGAEVRIGCSILPRYEIIPQHSLNLLVDSNEHRPQSTFVAALPITSAPSIYLDIVTPGHLARAPPAIV